MPSPAPRSNGLLFIGLGLIALALGGGAFYFLGQPSSEPAFDLPSASPPDAAAPRPDALLLPDAFVPEDAGPEMLSVGIVTSPPGARVEVLGSEGLACDSTPCNLALPVGEQVRLQAHLRNRSTIVEVGVVRGMPPVTIRLPGRAGGADDGDPGGEQVGPLKHPGFFRVP